MNAIKTLLVKRLRNELTAQEAAQLQEWTTRSVHNQALYDRLSDVEEVAILLAKMDEFDEKKGWDYVMQHAHKIKTAEPKAPVHRVHFLKTAWFKYAAAILLVVAAGTIYFFIHTSQSKMEVASTQPSPLPKEDVLPGSDKAILTLSNGQQVQLNNATSETIKDGTLSIENNDGQLSYSPGGTLSPAGAGDGSREARTVYNTMSTPKGGQYKLTLSDGTKVWLNAASSINYPTAFNEKTREVNITGEAYFEVAKNQSKPFIVTVASADKDAGRTQENDIRITVLGTHFNINSYPDEPSTKTTLLEGKIKVSKNQKTTILSPGQQAVIKQDITIDTSIDPEQTIAWKNGVFNFNNADLSTVMRQLERWYDIEVEYRGKTDQQFKFQGKLQRSLSLQQILKVLEKLEVKFKLEGKKLIVNP